MKKEILDESYQGGSGEPRRCQVCSWETDYVVKVIDRHVEKPNIA